MLLLKNFLRDERGQDLVEYTLLLAFVCLASAAIFITAGQSMTGIWGFTNTTLVNANKAASNAAGTGS
jgi:Flp pilus assembly pilin Flp